MHRIRFRRYEPNTTLTDVWPEANLQPDDEIIIPKDELYVITEDTDFGKFTVPSLSRPKITLRTNADYTGDTTGYS